MNDEERKERRKENKKEKEKMIEKYRIKMLLSSFCFIKFLVLKRHTPYSFIPTMCNPITRTSFVSRDHPFATCTCPPIYKCVFHLSPFSNI